MHAVGISGHRDVGAVVDNEECVALLREFITANPELWNEDIGVE